VNGMRLSVIWWHVHMMCVTVSFLGLHHSRQVLYHLSHSPSSFVCILFLRWNLSNFARGWPWNPSPPILLPVPPD
jgi:hypothetical protein